MPRAIEVLVADDSAFMRRAITKMLESQEDIRVVATARNGEDAVSKTLALHPDVVTMDVAMPEVDGLEAVRRIVAQARVPIIMVSAHTCEGAEITFRALELGAVDFIAKPDAAYTNIESVARDLIEKVRGLARHVIPSVEREGSGVERAPRPKRRPKVLAAAQCIAIGASTGGPVALTHLVPALPADFAAPVLIVQHMPLGFTGALAQRLDGLAKIRVREGHDGMLLEPGSATILPAGKQLALRRAGERVTLHLREDGGDSLHVPSVDVLASEVAQAYGAASVGVILTGMGHDGVIGLRSVKACGGYVVGQDEATSVVYGMPRAAALAGLVDRVAPLLEIPGILCGLLR
ncbi:MAG TPA: chemotaxis response regulator protein-glutamate methylesterase [Candidatus Tyrphobacter sp.]